MNPLRTLFTIFGVVTSASLNILNARPPLALKDLVIRNASASGLSVGSLMASFAHREPMNWVSGDSGSGSS